MIDEPAGRTPDERSEARLEALSREAAARGQVAGTGVSPSGAPLPAAPGSSGYYGLPLLKKPVWTWEVPTYFFVGGTAGAAALIAEVASFSADADALSRDARWIAGVGAALSPPLLISDLGRPERFLNMLRVFKLQSPMSVGAWTVVAFSNATAAALFAQRAQERFGRRLPIRIVGHAAGTAAAATGVGMATYTGVLLGVTAIPVWARNVRLLPALFGFSALGSAVSVLELRGHRHPALHTMGVLAAAVETAIDARLALTAARANEPLEHGRSGWLTRSGAWLSGPVPLALRLLGRRSSALSRAAAVSAIAGSLLTRFGWLAAGRASAGDPRQPLALPGQVACGSSDLPSAAR